MGHSTQEPRCDKCGNRYPEAGDGWNGLCPACADKADSGDESVHARQLRTVLDATRFVVQAEVVLDDIFDYDQVNLVQQLLDDLHAGSDEGRSNVVTVDELAQALVVDDKEIDTMIWQQLLTLVNYCKDNKAEVIIFL